MNIMKSGVGISIKNGSRETIVPARSGCRKCYGRGVMGRDPINKEEIVCSCILNKYKKIAPTVAPVIPK